MSVSEHLFKEQLNKLKPVPNFNWDNFISKCHFQDFGKKEFLIKEGAVEQKLHFLCEGVLRFFVEVKEKEITFDFVFPGTFFSAYTSYLTQLPVKYNIQALSKSTCYSILKTDLDKLYNQEVEGLYFAKWATEQQFLRKSARELSLLTESAEERYWSLLKNHKDLIKQIPQKYLASYIGITPQALSRIRRRIY